MANKYNAFISYRHAPEDIKIASEVQKQLERFKIPDEIQKKTGIKRFERVFRDKEELPITSDLNEDIDEAIENSDNLIVICSTRTGESIWVRKEIETFLKYHPRKNIFTVLVDGEPEDVIPDLLLHETVTVTNPDGTTEEKEELIEPLSCDYRLGIKKARKVELPRLAASLLGCSYDELIQRRRQYIRRRNTIIGTVSTCAGLGIIAYLVWSLLQIRMNYDLAQQNYELAQSNLALAQANYETAQANYMEALNNQSEFLATVSGRYLEADDRVSALQLALAALPSEGNERPVTTRAEYALTNALGCYMTPGAYAMEPIWMYSTDYEIVKFMITQDNTKLLALDAYGNITIWNTDDHSIYRVIPRDGSETLDFAINREGVLVINYNEKLTAYDATYENVLWSYDLDSNHRSYSDLRSVWTISEGEEVLYKGLTHTMVLNTMTGNVELDLDVLSWFPPEAGSVYSDSFSEVKASQDGRLIAMFFGKSGEDKKLWVYDRDTSGYVEMSGTFTHVFAMKFTSDDALLVSYQEKETENDTFIFGSMELLVRDIRRLSRFDARSGREVWGNDIPYTLSAGTTQIHLCEFDLPGETVPAVCTVFSNKLNIYELESGKVLASNEMTGEHIESYQTENGKGIVVTLKNGKFLYVPMQSEGFYIASYDYFLGGISEAKAFYSEEEDDSHYLVKYSDQNGIIEYDFTYYDTSYAGIDGVEPGDLIREAIICSDKVIMYSTQMNLYCYDPSTGSMDWRVKVPGDSYTSVRLVCSASDGILYLINRGVISGDDRGDKLFAVDISDGGMERVEGIPYGGSIVESCIEDKIVMASSYDDDLPSGLYVYDCTSHTTRSMELSGDIPLSFGTGCLAASPDGSKAVYIPYVYEEEDAAAYLIDLETGSSVKNSSPKASFAAWDQSSEHFAIGCPEYTDIYDVSGNKLVTVPKGDSEIVGIAFCDKGLITYSQLNTLSLYDLSGNMVGNSQLIGRANSEFRDLTFIPYGDEMLVTCGSYSNMIDLDDFEVRTYAVGVMCYDPGMRRFYVKNFDEYSVLPLFGYYDRLSVDELIEKGYEYLGDAALSDEMKNLYGIS